MFVYSETFDAHQRRRLFFPLVNFVRSRTIFLSFFAVSGEFFVCEVEKKKNVTAEK